jgi:hypothetical protein
MGPTGRQLLHTTNQGDKVKSTEHNAKSAVRPKAGRFATLRALLHAPGNGAPTRGLAVAPFVVRSLAALYAVLGLLVVVAAGVARAEPPRLIPDGSFNPGRLPLGITVDQSSGDLYVGGFFESDINKFDAAGKRIAPPSPFGAGTEHFASVAVNPANGDVYGLDALSSEIDVFDPSSGALLSSFPVPASLNFFGLLTIVQIATDSAGNVYLPVVPENKVLEYGQDGTLLKEFTGGAGAGALKEPIGVAVDSAGALWVADTGNARIEELSPGDAPLAEIGSKGVQTLALDGRGDVFAIVKNNQDFCGSIAQPCPHLVEYSASGAQLADVGAGLFETGEAGIRLPPMVAVDEASHRVYVSDSSNEAISIYSPPAPPVVARELTAEVTSSEVKLGALVNPGGIQTTYRFEYGTSAAYGQSAPLPEGSVGEGLGSRTVWAAASGLAPGTTYHYRVVATSELGKVQGPDQTFTTLTAEQAACPNEQLRGSFSARLPDCRGYELVLEPSTTLEEIFGAGPAAADGDAIAFKLPDPLAGAPTAGYSGVATRGPNGWSPEDVMPLEAYSGTTCAAFSSSFIGDSDESSRALISIGADTRAGDPEGSKLEKQECNAEGLQVVAGEPVGYQNLLIRDNLTGTYQLVNAPEPGLGASPEDAHFQGASADLSHIVFTEKARLTANALYDTEDLYEWNEGIVRLVSVLPDGTPVVGSLPESSAGTNVVSAEGPHNSHVFFTAAGNLYVRIDGERTVQVDVTYGSGSSGGGSFQAASTDGTKVLFTDAARLTANSTAQPGEPDLYECVLATGASQCELRDLAVAKAGEQADVLHAGPFGSRDSSHVYFVAEGVLAANRREYEDAEGNMVTEQAQAGQHNLYVWNGETQTTSYIVTLDTGEGGFGQVSPDGTWFAFNSEKSLTGYDNDDAGGTRVSEAFLVNVPSGRVVCASCNPSGEAPVSGGGAAIRVDASVSSYGLSDGGRLLFETREALVPSDTDGQTDVYEYEDGHVYLISGGTSADGSQLVSGSESGDDVFFLSTQQLVPQDTSSEARLLYDARVDGGLPFASSPPPCTTADACRAPASPQPAIFGAPTSQTFTGVGNLTPQIEAAVKSKGKKSKGAKPKGTKGKLRHRAKRKVCGRNARKRSRCLVRSRRARAKTKSDKGGK